MSREFPETARRVSGPSLHPNQRAGQRRNRCERGRRDTRRAVPGRGDGGRSDSAIAQDRAARYGSGRAGDALRIRDRVCERRRSARGSWVREELLDMPAAPPLDELPLATATPAPQPSLEGFTFEGYRNADGTVGTRNILGITTTVQCVAPTVDYAAQRIREEILPRYPNVDGVVAMTHTYGCGVAIDAPGRGGSHPHDPEHQRAIRISAGAAGGEPGMREAAACAAVSGNGARCRFWMTGNIIRLQDERGFQESVAAIMRAAERRLAEINRRQRETCPASELIVGLQCGGSDAFSGVTCNPAVGYRGGSAGARRRDRDVFGSHRSARRGPPADAARSDAGCGARPDSRDALV